MHNYLNVLDMYVLVSLHL